MLARRTGHADERCLPFLGRRCLYRRSPRPGTELMTNARTAPRRGSRGYALSLRPRLAGLVLAPAVGGLVGSLLVLVTAGRAATVPGATPPSRWGGLLAPVHGDWMPGLVPLALIAGVSLLLGSWLTPAISASGTRPGIQSPWTGASRPHHRLGGVAPGTVSYTHLRAHET